MMTAPRFALGHPAPDGPPHQAELAALADEAWAFHRALPGYAPTPVARLDALARTLGLGTLALKDESFRFGLNAFKGLGASFAVDRWLRTRARGAGPYTFTTATDGNHGHAVAWAARMAGHRAVVFVPAHTVPARIARIAGEGAEVRVVHGEYDEAVQAADAAARDHGWVLIQDTAYDGYEEIPQWIVGGYTTHCRELEASAFAAGAPAADLALLHAGVGSWAASVVAYLWHRYGARRPRLLIVEPTAADCLLASAEAGRFAHATGDLRTIMAGLCCGTPSTTAWTMLRDGVDAFMAVPDGWAEQAMRRLAHPLPGDDRVIAGESGAASVAGLMALMRAPELAPLRDALGAGPATRVLVFSTEGDTDPDAWRRITATPPEAP
ncbi:MAG: diaminopropionate ammonia-lyase [Gemmatimonadales bacterium]|nr:diaminopropionate ammonia-lyase [Gemmatimonadales bacterium]